MSTTNIDKKKVFDEWIKGDHILLHFDSRLSEVVVPANLKDNYALTLKLSMLFQGETKCDENEISSYLKFSGEYFQCIIPWKSIWGMTSEEGTQKIWEKDIPKEMYRELLKNSLRNVGTKIKHSLGLKTDITKNNAEKSGEKSKDNSGPKLFALNGKKISEEQFENKSDNHLNFETAKSKNRPRATNPASDNIAPENFIKDGKTNDVITKDNSKAPETPNKPNPGLKRIK
ncbi:MAG TPA: hypothetical protein PKA63_13275 [Oligoflexia bacterium]|nr:hypothetical protein [Oligoflexia bacterium]HMP49632.1 hypothetical protein [Oligoflexia bacterium]